MRRLRIALLEALAGVRPARAGFLREGLAPLGISAGSRVVQLGVGTGSLTKRLSRAVGPDGEVVVFARNLALGERMRRRMVREGLSNVSVRRFDGIRTGVPDRRFDRACSVLFLYTLGYGDRCGMLDEMRRIVTPGVCVLVIDFRRPRRGAFVKAMRALRFLAPDPEGYRTLFRPGGVVSEARDAGFAVRSRAPLGPFGMFDALVLEKLPPRGEKRGDAP